jgi:cyclopropane fatty-acyl-phospholipid synthase-like methyltransferase
MAWRRFRAAPLAARVLMTLRPRICPLGLVADAVPHAARVLDVGCGAGLLLQWLDEARGLVRGVGVDVSARAIAVARACAPRGGVLEFIRLPADAPWPEGPFDVVTAVDVLHHVPPEEQRGFVRRLAETGARLVVLKDVAPRPRWKAWANALHDFLMTRSRVWPRAMDEVAAWLAEDGWRVTRAERADMLCYSHYLVAGERDATGSSPGKDDA